MKKNLIKVYIMNVTPLNNGELFGKAWEALSAERRKKTASFRFQKDRNLSAGAELLLKYALRAEGIEKEPEYIYGSEGKAYLKNIDLYFNISHSGEYVICSLSRHENGCDIEEIKKENTDLAKRFFHEKEYSAIMSRPEEKRTDIFFRFWTLKESFMKATGKGMSIPLRSFCISIDGEIRVEQSLDEREYSFTEFSCIDGCKCAVCTAEKDVKAELIRVEAEKII